MTKAKMNAPTPLHQDDIDTRLERSMERLYASIECLCSHVSENTAAQGEVIKELVLLRIRLEQIFGQLDRGELFLGTHTDYPDTQARIAGADQIRQRIIRDGQGARVREALDIVAALLNEATEATQ